MERRNAIQIKEAVSKVMKFAKVGVCEYLPIDDINGRYLGEPIKATHDVPPFDRAPYDGFAIRAEDSRLANQNNPVTFKVVEEIGAGHVPTKDLKPFEAIRIMTGALMPEQCDAVVMLELAQESVQDGQAFMSIKRLFKPGDNVSFKGSETKEGDILVEAGRKINPGIMALLSTFGYAKVPVVKKPVVGLFATGTELLDVDQPLEPGKIRNSNSYMINAQVQRAGAKDVYFGKLEDDFDLCYEAIKEALDKVDFLVTTGGVSVGDYDYLPDIYKKLGAEILFNKVAMRPGSVTTVAAYNGKLLFGLSGNPSACYVGFELFVRPIIRHWYRSNKPHLKKIKAILDTDFPKPNPFTRFVRSFIGFEGTTVKVSPSGVDKSNVVTSLANADSFMILPGGTRGYQKGMEVDVLLLENEEGDTWPWE